MNRQGYTGLDSNLPESLNLMNRPFVESALDVSVSAGFSGQAHLFLLGGSVESGATVDNNGTACGYVKVCGVVGPGLFFGTGGTAGGGQGALSSGAQPSTSRFVAAGSWFGGVGISGDVNSGGASGFADVRTRLDYRGGFGAVIGVTGCRQFNACSAPDRGKP